MDSRHIKTAPDSNCERLAGGVLAFCRGVFFLLLILGGTFGFIAWYARNYIG